MYGREHFSFDIATDVTEYMAENVSGMLTVNFAKCTTRNLFWLWTQIELFVVL